MPNLTGVHGNARARSSPYCPCSHRKDDIGGCTPGNPDRKHTTRFDKEMTVCMQFPQSATDSFTVLDDYLDRTKA
jgi:hypothetical protein